MIRKVVLLPAPFGPRTDDLALVDLEREIVKRDLRAVPLHELLDGDHGRSDCAGGRRRLPTTRSQGAALCARSHTLASARPLASRHPDRVR